ncbi:MAG: carbonate dehydratase [Betaproteobacteria bacterium]|nr:carbonate dehydratase [Betaproteobacteria bacterium]
MSDMIAQLFDNNRAWSDRMQTEDPAYFLRLVRQQSPDYLWIGCSDSRVPANQIIGLDPGEVFVHRNVANVVAHDDLNALSVIQFAVDVLRVKHILVVGHYGCGGVRAALNDEKFGLVDNWLRHVQDVRNLYTAQLAQTHDAAWRHDRLCELNAIHQAVNICRTTVLRDAWQRGQEVTVHAWCYSLHDGLVNDLKVSARSREEAAEQAENATARMFWMRNRRRRNAGEPTQ